MFDFDSYKDLYPYVRLTRDDGILTVHFHTDGGPWQFGQTAQDTMTRLFRDIAGDKKTRIVILEASGESFCTDYNLAEIQTSIAGFDTSWADRWMTNGRNMLAAMLEVEAPMIWCLNGPITVHPEFFFGASDIVLADPSAYVQDLTHIGGGKPDCGGHHPRLGVAARPGARTLFSSHGSKDRRRGTACARNSA